MDTGRGSGDPEGEEQHEHRRQNIINQHFYHGPVNQIQRADNCNFGVNNGNIIQSRGASAPSASSSDVHGREPQAEGSSIARPLILSGSQHDILALLNPILDASHTRNRRVSPPNSACFPGTRETVIEVIHSWANSSLIFNNIPHIMWIYGYAGCGKSAIAQGVAEYFAAKGQLAASFFFFRGSGDRSNISRFATTVASQMASAIPATAPSIKTAVVKNRGLLTTTTSTLSAQFQHLVYEPVNAIRWERLAASLRSKPFLIVLDGLDECEDRGEVAAFIEQMISFFTKKPRTPLRFLITSRVESHIHQCLHSSNQVRLLDLVKHTSDLDIEAALDVAIEKEKRSRLLACAKDWPTPEDKAKLVEHIGGSYIFLTTIIRLLFDPNINDGLTPMTRLPRILSEAPDFDDLYRTILGPSQHLPHFQDIISTIALALRPLSIVEIAELMELETVDVVNVLVNLHAIMQIPGDDRTAVSLWHTSLRDFLCSEDRSGPLFANPNHHLRIAYRHTTSDPHGPHLGTPSSQYLWEFALVHFGKFLDTLDDVSSSINSERDCVTGLLDGPIFKSSSIKTFLHPVVVANSIHQISDGQTALEFASRTEKWTIVRALVNANVDVNTQFQGGVLHGECRVGSAFQAAYHYEELDMIEFLLEKGADPNAGGTCYYRSGFQHVTPLAFAAYKKDVKFVSRLLDYGADPNLQGGFYGTALQAACTVTSVEMVKLLLDHGADPNLRGGIYGSALHACARWENTSCAQPLLMRKADPNIQDESGNTPLHLACFTGHIKVAETLLKFKVDATIKNKDGRTALQEARDGKYEHLVQMLSRHGIVE